ncbi:MAG: VWA-like domain-containing protein [Chitinophagaceae bacterium]|jgi:predicted metal-dependent peptidase|nr:VWA-like domain-containing protein [Chitinophagaceae bacterium]
MTDTNPHQLFSRATLDLLFKEPFYAHVLQGVTRGLTDSIRTAAVRRIGGSTELVFNPVFLTEKLDRQTRIGVLKHEVLHLVFRHLDRVSGSKAYPELFNIAADIVVNQYIDRAQLPEGAITLQSFPELDLPAGETVEYYYKRLSEVVDRLDLTWIAVDLFESHEGWWSPGGAGDDGMSRLARERLDRLLAEAWAAANGKGHTHLPGQVVKELSALADRLRSSLDWRRILRAFAQSSARGDLQYTIKRQSRRFGTRPGLRIRRVSRLLVAVDTSGSITDAELHRFFAEIDAIHRAGAYVHIVECDAKVQRDYPYNGRKPESVAGRGGTSFDPVFTFINRSIHRFDGCIYLTDGFASRPQVRPRCPLLWALTPGGDARHLDHGRHVRISG